MSNFYRRDDYLQDSMGNPISGVSVYLLDQPANNTNPPTPQARIYADALGTVPIIQPVITDAYGHASYYAEQGLYTCLYYSPQIDGLQVVLVDQAIVPPQSNNPSWNFDSTAN